MNFVGLDLGSHSLKAVELKKTKKGEKKELVGYDSAPAPPQSLASEAEVDLVAFSESLRNFFDEANFSTQNVAAALPESQVFTRVISVPQMNPKELENAMKWEAEQYIPIPLEEVSLDYRIIEEKVVKGKDGRDLMDILLVAAPLTLTKKYLKIINDAGLKVVGLETEAMAAARSLVGLNSSSPTTMVVSLGAETTDISVVSEGNIRFTRSISTGGEAFARAVSQELGLEMTQAEEYTKSYGLEESELEGKVMKAIKPVFDVVVSEIKRSFAYYASQRQDDPLRRIVLAGGIAGLPGILAYLAAAVDVEVQLGDPWRSVAIPSKFDREELEDLGPKFAVAVGLALKDI